MKKSLILSISALTIFSLLGCGSSSDGDDGANVDTEINQEIPVEDSLKTVSGRFGVNPISGVDYSCSSGLSGMTNDEGEYTCNDGDSVEFALGNYVIGTGDSVTGIIIPTDFDLDRASVIDIAQLLYSLDTDQTDNMVSIIEDFSGLDEVETMPGDADFDSLIGTALNIDLVDELTAEIFLNEVIEPEVVAPEDILTPLFLGTTQYSINAKGVATMRTFESDGTYSGTLTIPEQDVKATTGEYRIEGDVIYLTRLTPFNSEFVVTYMSHSEGEIILSSIMNGGDPFDTYFYTDEARMEVKKQEILDSL